MIEIFGCLELRFEWIIFPLKLFICFKENSLTIDKKYLSTCLRGLLKANLLQLKHYCAVVDLLVVATFCTILWRPTKTRNCFEALRPESLFITLFFCIDFKRHDGVTQGPHCNHVAPTHRNKTFGNILT